MGERADVIEKTIRNTLKPYEGMATTLSGGIDSGLMAALVKPSAAVTVTLPGGERYDELDDASMVAEHLRLKHIVIGLNDKEFVSAMKIAVKVIGRSTPHFNIFPLYCMFRELAERGIKEILIADGPDETLCGYTRHLIMYHMYVKPMIMEAFKNYESVVRKIHNHLPDPISMYFHIINKDVDYQCLNPNLSLLTNMCLVDIKYMRPDMDIMANQLSAYFGIKIHRPFEKLDELFLSLSDEDKVDPSGEYGKYVLRQIADKYLPKEIAWKKHKVGGPVYPVNLIMGWDCEEFDKKLYLKMQEDILCR